MTDNPRIRFMENNFSTKIKTVTSQNSSFPVTNIHNDLRGRVWMPTGHFTPSAGYKLWVNNGTDRIVSIPVAQLAQTPEQYAANIKTVLNQDALPATWDVTYSQTTKKFTVSNSTPFTFQHSKQLYDNTSLHTIIGFTAKNDVSGTTHEAQEARIHSSEEILWDMGVPTPMSFFSMLPPIDENFSLSPTASIKLMADHINSSTIWTNGPSYEVTLEHSHSGVMKFLDKVGDEFPTYRYWKLEIKDVTNPNPISVGHIYLGDYLTLNIRNISRGFTRNLVDNSIESISDSGSAYYNIKPKFTEMSGLKTQFISASDRATLEGFFIRHGKHKPFYISLDPLLGMSRDIFENTRFVRFADPPKMSHVKCDYYTLDFQVREAI